MSNVAAAWRNSNDAVKSKYVTLAEQDKKRYTEEKKTISTALSI